MKKLIKNISILLSIYCFYKIILFSAIAIISQSGYCKSPHAGALNYGTDQTKKKQIIILGSSNTRYNFDYSRLNDSLRKISVHSLSSSSPFGLYFTLTKFIESKWNNRNNTVILDLIYTSYNKDEFLPFTDATIYCMTFSHAWKLIRMSPRSFFGFLFNESIYNGLVGNFFLTAFKNYRMGKELAQNKAEADMKVVPLQNFGLEYNNCTTPYNKTRHFIADVQLSEYHLSFLRSYINSNFLSKAYFLLPEINKGNFGVSYNTVALIEKYFKPINKFSVSQFPDSYMYDQFYHLNNCGAVLNTNYLLHRITQMGIASQ